MTRNEIKIQVSKLLEEKPEYRIRIEKIIDSLEEPISKLVAQALIHRIKIVLQSSDPEKGIASLESSLSNKFLTFFIKHTALILLISVFMVNVIFLLQKGTNLTFIILDSFCWAVITFFFRKSIFRDKSIGEGGLSERFWRNLSTAFGWLAIATLFAFITISSSMEIRDLDLWLHWRMGWWICHHGFVPNYDVLSCSIAGKPWVNHEWLFQVIVYQIQQAFGFNGLITMQSIVVVITFVVLLFLGYSRERLWLLVYVLFMVVMVYQTRFTIRPDIFSLLFFVLYIYVLSLYLNKRWAIYALIILQVLWTNMHGFFFFGPLLVGVAVFSEFAKRRLPLPYEWNTVGRLSDQEYSALKKIFPVLILSCCLNPLTFQGAWYPLKVFFHLSGSNQIFFDNIVELQKPFTLKTIFTDQYLWYKVLILISAYSFVFNRRKIDISSLLVWLIFLGFSLAAIRNMVFFAVAAYMIFMVNVISTPWDEFAPMRFTSYVFKYLVILLFTCWIILRMLNMITDMSSNGYFDFDNYHRKSEFFGVSKRMYPYKAADFLIREKITGNFFNDFNSGAYLTGKVYPNVRVFIDGRTEEYGAKFFENYQKIWKGGNAKVFEFFERQDNLTGAFLNNTRQQIPPPVLKMFHSFKNWSLVYLDDDAVIFLKETPANLPFIDRFSIDLNKWKAKPMDLLALGTTRLDPFPFTSRAYVLETLGADEAAIKESKEALAVEPSDGPAYTILGKIYLKRRDYKKAFQDYRLGSMYSGSKESRLGLAQSYDGLKDYHGAVIQYLKVLDSSPNEVLAYFGLAKCYAEMGQDKKALFLLEKAKKLHLEDKVDDQKIRDIIKGHKKISKSK